MQHPKEPPSLPVSAQSVDTIMKETLASVPWIKIYADSAPFAAPLAAGSSSQATTTLVSVDAGVPSNDVLGNASLWQTQVKPLSYLLSSSLSPSSSPLERQQQQQLPPSESGTFELTSSSSKSNSVTNKSNSKVYFPPHFVPTIHHVICGRGKRSYGHIGNTQFALAVANGGILRDKYETATTKQEKTDLVQSIVDSVERKGGFIRLDAMTGLYYKTGDQDGREKTSQALRDCLKHKYKSSKDIKRQHRKERRMAKQAPTTSPSRAFGVVQDSMEGIPEVNDRHPLEKATLGDETSTMQSRVRSLYQCLEPESTATVEKASGAMIQIATTTNSDKKLLAIPPPSFQQVMLTQARSFIPQRGVFSNVELPSINREMPPLALPTNACNREMPSLSLPPHFVFAETTPFQSLLCPPRKMRSTMDDTTMKLQAMPPPTSFLDQRPWIHEQRARSSYQHPASLPPRAVSLSVSDRQRIYDNFIILQEQLQQQQPQQIHPQQVLQQQEGGLHLEPLSWNPPELDDISQLSDLDALELLHQH